MPAHRARRARPQLEVLEDRQVPAAPATFKVTTLADVVDDHDGLVSLREAISAANATAEADTIQLKAGEYKIASSEGAANDNSNGDFDVTNPLIIKGKDETATFIDGNQLSRIFDVIGTFDIQFKKVTLRNGAINNSGGAIQTLSANLVLKKTTVSGNSGVDGGGLFAQSGNITLIDSTVADNVGAGFIIGEGGGIYAQTGTVRLINSTVRGNSAALNGGGINVEMGTLDLTDSTVSDNRAGFNGGGVFCRGGLTLDNCTISSNVSQFGAGIACFGNAPATIANSVISTNSATSIGGIGGGIAIDSGPLTVTNSTILTNVAQQDAGGIFARTGRVSISQSSISSNRATSGSGGGIYTQDNQSQLIVDSCTLFGNFAANDGGAVRARGGEFSLIASTVFGNQAAHGGAILSDCMLTMSSSTLNDNVATVDGGGLLLYQQANLTNSTFSGNKASGAGGGIFTFGTLTLLNGTVHLNEAPTGGGVFCSSMGSATVANTIVAGNQATVEFLKSDLSGAFTSQGHNVIGIGYMGSGFTNDVQGDKVGFLDAVLDPKLGPLANNGGLTLTHALKSGSPAIDSADTAAAPTTDQRGVARPKDGDKNGSKLPDIGAFEK